MKKVTVQAGPLKGARYGDICLEDLRKSARAYRADPRFHQYAKRMMSERALGAAPNSVPPLDREPVGSRRCCPWKKTLEWGAWVFCKTRGRIVLATVFSLLLLLILSRPLFYVVFAKGLKVLIRVTLRRSVGLLVLLIDAILDEAAESLEAGLLSSPTSSDTTARSDNQERFEVQQQHTIMALLVNCLFTLAGVILGRHWHGGVAAARIPNRLRVAGAQRP